MAGHANWASLHVDLLSAVLGALNHLHHVAAGGALYAADASRLLASCSPNRHWRSVALGQVRCRVRLASLSECASLALHPGPPCTQLELPPPPCGQAAWEERQVEAQREAAARQLLASTAFQRRSGTSLAVLLNCPAAAAGSGAGLLQHFPALQQLEASAGRGGCSPAGGLSLGRCPPSLRCLSLRLPAGGVLRRAGLPAHLQHCELVAGGSRMGGGHCQLAPEEGAGCAGFWGTCHSLQLTAAAGGLLLSLDHCQALGSCTALRVSCAPPHGSSQHGPAAAAAAAAEVVAPSARQGGAHLHRWLQALAPLFAATQLQVLEAQACAASLHTALDGSQPLLLVGEGPPSWQPAELTAADLQAGSRQIECHGGLVAELRRCGDVFKLSVCRCQDGLVTT